MNQMESQSDSRFFDTVASQDKILAVVAFGAIVFVLLNAFPIFDSIVAGFAGGFVGTKVWKHCLPMIYCGISGAIIALLVNVAVGYFMNGQLPALASINEWREWLALIGIVAWSAPGIAMAYLLKQN